MTIEQKLKEALRTMPSGFTTEVRRRIIAESRSLRKASTHRHVFSYKAVFVTMLPVIMIGAGIMVYPHLKHSGDVNTGSVGQIQKQNESLRGSQTLQSWGGFLQFKMMTTKVGWIIANQETQVLRTDNGGKYWNNVSPEKSSLFGDPKDHIIASDFIDQKHAVVAVSANNNITPSTNGPVTIYTTSNGGLTWQAVPLKIPENLEKTPISISFINPQTGWVLVGEGVGQDRLHVTVFHTSDFGRSWTKVSTTGTNPGTATTISQNGLPLGTDKVGMTFANDSVGFISLVNNASNNALTSPLFVTLDGGQTWSASKLKLPSGADFGRPPVFSDSKDGTFDVEYVNPDMSLFLSTTDGGHSWTAGGKLEYSVPKGTQFAIPDILNQNDLFVVAGGKLYSSQDGGSTWKSHPIPANIHQVSFVNPQCGFGIGMEAELYKTTNGGADWTQIDPVITQPK